MTRVAILAYDGCLATEIYGMSDLLLIANRVVESTGVDRPPFQMSVVSPSEGVVRPASGAPIATTQAHQDVDQLVVPGFPAVPRGDLDPVLDPLQRDAAFVRLIASKELPVASVCVGAFLLGEAGLLDGRAATTGWLFSGLLAARYPEARVWGKEMLIEDGPVTTTGAFSAVFDLALHLIRRHFDDTVARSTARIALVANNRWSQAPHIDEALRALRSQPFSEGVRQRLLERLTEPYDLARIAQASGVSTRTLLRRFGAETGESPLAFLQRSRIELAKRLLEEPGARVSEVMHHVGYLDPGAFRKLFVRHAGLTPAAYRRQFTDADSNSQTGGQPSVSLQKWRPVPR